ncbi:MAG: phosphatase PAP2 family protein [Actinomycetota bacterium]|nr:phosphatase PAP2 family protein [Actinomycetota bacterium]MDA8396712.1 phosphatase PAP2 family protein [Actinomycetota bacterium]
MGSLRTLDNSWYIDVNHFARTTGWAHSFMEFYALYAGIAFLGLLLLAAWWSARHDHDPAVAVARVLWAAGGTVLAWMCSSLLFKPLIGERRPYWTLHGMEVLLAKTQEFSFPSGHATIAGAVIAGLWLARRRILASIATVAGLLLAFGRVYVGVHYPWDVVAGFIWGAAFIMVLSPIAVRIIAWFTALFLGTPLASLVVARQGASGQTITSVRQGTRA